MKSYKLAHSLDKLSLLPYLGILLVLLDVIVKIKIHPSGDTVALVNGIDFAISCLSQSPAKIPCGGEVVHFPIFQYLFGAPLIILGLENHTVVYILGALSLIWFFIAALTYWRAGNLSAGRVGGHLGLLLLISGYILWYMRSSFNEATSFALFSLLAFSVLNRWKLPVFAGIALLCTITKEVAFPFVIYFAFLAFWVRKLEYYNEAKLSTMVAEFVSEYKLGILFVGVGVLINFGFNIFRFGSMKNLGLSDPKYFTPWEYVPEYFVNLLYSPAGGLLFTWLSLCLMLLITLILLRRKRRERMIAAALIMGLFAVNFGLSRWYSPFGWYAWGPRLTLPYLGSIGIIGLYLIAPYITKYICDCKKKNSATLVLFVVVALSSLPNLSVMIDEGAFFSKMFAPTTTAINSGLDEFIIQTAPVKVYADAAIESFKRKIIIPQTIDTLLKHYLLAFIWLTSIYLVTFKIREECLPSTLKSARSNTTLDVHRSGCS